MKIEYSTQLLYPYECATLLMRKVCPQDCTREDVFEPLEKIMAHLSDVHQISPDLLAPHFQPLIEISDFVWENLSIPREKLEFYFAQPNGDFDSIGGTIASMEFHHLDYGTLTPEKKLWFVGILWQDSVDLFSTDFPAPQNEKELFDRIDKSALSPEKKLELLQFYYHGQEYQAEVREILRQAEILFRKKEFLVSEAAQKCIAYIRENISARGLAYFDEFFPIKTDSSILSLHPSVMRLNGITLDSLPLTLNNAPAPDYLQVGILYETIRQLLLQNGSSEEKLSARLKALGDKRRLEILRALKKQSLCGQELADLTGLTPATVSHHMSALIQEGFITIEKAGTKINYTVCAKGIESLLENLRHSLL